MPRKTRAAARAQEADIDIATDDTQTEVRLGHAEQAKESERPALVELTANAVEDIELELEMKDDIKDTKRGRSPTKKTAKKGKNTAAKGKKSPKSEPKEDSAEESASGSEASAEKENEAELTTPLKNEIPVAMDSEASASPNESDATPSMTTTVNIVEQREVSPDSDAAQKLEALFDAPAEPANEEPVQEIAAAAAVASQAAEPKSAPKSSAKKVVTKRTVNSAKSSTSPSMRKTSPTSSSKAVVKKEPVRPSATLKSRASLAAKPRLSIAPKSRPSTLKARPSAFMSAKSSPAKTASTVRLPKTSPSAKEEETKKHSEIAALNTPPKPAKSTKPITTSTFKLPSEALQEKFKAQREERQKRQEEQAQKQKNNTLRPSIPQKHTTKPREVPEVKLNKASAARMSISNTLKERPNGFKVPTEKKAGTMKASHRPSLSVSSGNAAKGPRPQAHARSVSSTSKPDISKPTIFMTAAEKQEAAKKARTEAAERGRAVSKAWAEKKQKDLKAKQASAKAANEESKENTDPAPVAIDAV